MSRLPTTENPPNAPTGTVFAHKKPYSCRAKPKRKSSASERRLIGRRTQSDRAANANGNVSTETMNVFELIIGKGHLKNYEYNSTYSIHWHDVCDKQNTTKPFCQKLLFI